MRLPRAALSALALALSAALVAGPAPASQPTAARDGASAGGGVGVIITVAAMRNARGQVLACLTANREQFPDCRDDPAAHKLVVTASRATTIRFAGVQPGTYAVALLHDENGNGKVDRAFGLIPREGFGFSRDAKVRMGPPSFTDAAFSVVAQPVHQTIRMRYML